MNRSAASLLLIILSGALLLISAPSNSVFSQPSATTFKNTAKLVPQLGHAGLIGAATFSPDGGLIATASDDGIAIIWDTKSGLTVRRIDPLWRYENMQAPIAGVTFSATGKFLYLWSQHWGFVRELRLAATGERLDWFGEAYSPEFSTDDRYVIGVEGDAAVVWNAANGRELWRDRPPQGFGSSAGFSPDNRLVIVERYRQDTSTDTDGPPLPVIPLPLVLRDVLTGRVIPRYVQNTEKILCIDFWPDKQRALTGGSDGIVRLWDTSSGRLLQRFGTLATAVVSVEFLDGTRFFAGGSDGQARIWNSSGGAPLKVFRAESEDFSEAELSTDGRFALTDSGSGTRLWQTDDLTEPAWFKPIAESEDITDAEFSPDGKLLIIEKFISSDPKVVRVFELATGNEAKWLSEKKEALSSIEFSEDGSSILTGSDDAITRLWNVQSRKVVQRYESHSEIVSSADVSQHRPYILTMTDDSHLWDATTGKEIRTFKGESAFFPAGKYIATTVIENQKSWTILSNIEDGEEYRRFPGSYKLATSNGAFLFTRVGAGAAAKVTQWNVEGNKEERSYEGSLEANTEGARQILIVNGKQFACWDVETGDRMWHSEFAGPINARSMIRLSPNGNYALFTAALATSAVVYRTKDGKLIRRITNRELGRGEGFSAAAFSPDSTQLVLGFNWGADAVLIECATGKELRRLTTNKLGFYSPVFSSDGRLIVAIMDGPAGLWEVATGSRIHTFGTDITHVGFTSAQGRKILLDGNTTATVPKDNLLVITGNREGATQLWTTVEPRLICSLYSFGNNSWAVADEFGRFDTNDLEEVRSLHWVLPTEPMRPLPIEILMRQLYEPRLLPRALAEDPMTGDLPELTRLNWRQPTVSILNVKPGAEGRVAVEIEVAAQLQGLSARDARAAVYDLRLFRDGQLVGHLPSNSGRLNLDQATGRRVFTFSGVRLPHHNPQTKVEFSAYAFNSDRIKTATSRYEYKYERWVGAPPPRAYLLTVGVNTFQSPLVQPLLFPSNDARRIRDTLSQNLAGTRRYTSGNIVQIPLIADFENRNGEMILAPTKENFKTALRLLAGTEVPANSLQSFPLGILNLIRPVTPDDLVLISFSTHGEADERGNFYLYPFDTGQSLEATELRRHLISSEELSQWVRDLDAGELVMILDACHSGAAPGAGFKPGPMGSRGLGQLAYDKGMRILAATQADNIALGSGESAGGLLTTALIRDGIQNGEAAIDGRVMLGRWLDYGTRRVPLIYAQEIPEEVRRKVQLPGLFDFSKKQKDLVIAILE